MQIKCGTDIIEIARIKETIEDTDGAFLKRVYTQSEIAYCEAKKKMKQKRLPLKQFLNFLHPTKSHGKTSK